MRSSGYTSYKQWENDRMRLNADPDDERLLYEIVSKISFTEEFLREAIVDELMAHMMDHRPLEFVYFYQRNFAKDSVVLIKSKDDIYFEV